MELLHSKGTIEKLLVAQEHHQDGNLHLHAYAKYKNELRIKKPDFLDIIDANAPLGKYHPNMQGAKSAYKVITYVSKHDKEPYVEGMDLKDELESREGHRKMLGKRLMEEPIQDVIADH